MKHTEGKCSEPVWDGWHSRHCTRPGVIERDGKLYCKQHDPEAVKARQEAANAKYRKKSEESENNHRRQQACLRALSALTTEQIEGGAVERLAKAAKAMYSHFIGDDIEENGIWHNDLVKVAEQVRAALKPCEGKEEGD
jgi:uncharacterized Zn finger protein (UPF0148 family)